MQNYTKYVLRLVSYSLFVTTLGFTLLNDLKLYATVPKLIEVSITYPRHAFLTHWMVWIQLIYYTIGFLALVFKSQSLLNFADTMRSGLVFPLCTFACTSFWVIFSIDREMIYPTYYDSLIPAYQNHLWHSLPATLQLYDLVFFKHKIPSMIKNVIFMVGFFAVYFGRCYLFFLDKSIWPYAFMTHIWSAGEMYFIVLILMFFLLVILFMYSGNAIHRLIYYKDKKKIK